MKLFLFVLIAIQFAIRVFADGIPVDQKTGKISVPFTAIKISENQIEEIEALGTLTLTNVEWEQFRKEGKNCPKRFEVVPINYRGCTCGMGNYVIQISKDSVAILRNSIIGNAGRDLSNFLQFQSDQVSLSVDHRGQFYFSGILIPFDSLISSITNTKIMKNRIGADTNRVLFINKPFGMSTNSFQLRSRFDKINKAAKISGLTIFTE
jgi:hypothetical protein